MLPGLAALRAAGDLGEGFRLAGAGREDWDDERFRGWACAQLERHAADLPAPARDTVVSSASYRPADVTDPGSVAAVIAGGGPVAAYQALPPVVFPPGVTALHGAGLADGSMIVLGKPFGESLADAERMYGTSAPRARVLSERATARA